MRLDANKKRAIRRLWRSDLSWDEICSDLACSSQQLEDMRFHLGLPEREDPDTYIPTPEEIRVKCAEIRQGWTEQEREARLVRRGGILR